MPLHVLNYRDGAVRSYSRSPVITLVTDAPNADGLPEEVRDAADSVITGNIDPLRNGKIPGGADGVLIWFETDQLLQGSSSLLRKNFRAPGRRVWVPVHYPYLDEMDLIAIQPRALVKGRPQDYWSQDIRVRSAGRASERVLAAIRASGQPWAKLSLALLEELAKPGAGAKGLVELWQGAAQLPPALAALALRNLVAVLIRHRELAQAGELLEQGLNAYRSYSELFYIKAVLCFLEKAFPKVMPNLKQARLGSRAFIGSGGESTYRIDWLTALLALRLGNDRVAFQCLSSGMNSNPPFLPAVEEVLKLRLPPELVERRQFDFCRLVRRELQLLDRTFDYLLLHRAFPAAQCLMETLPLSEEKRAELRQRLERGSAPFKPGPGTEVTKPGVILEGHFVEHSSLARINREIGTSLVQNSELEGALEPSTYGCILPQAVAEGDLIRQGMNRHPERLDLTIRHRWPPDFSRPVRGKLAVILPWEYGAVPRVWINQINRNVDELWVPSRFVRDVFVRCGVPAERVRVIPNGIDLNLFTPKGSTSRPQGARKFVFLFVGGAIRRKGVDLLLDAYREAFEPGEDVTLLITALGAQAAYLHNSLLGTVMAYTHDPTAPTAEIVTDELDDATLASLYRGCDAFVLPYRAEGFCMPVLEAMACGKPVITTAAGPSQDFCTTATAYLIPAQEIRVPDTPPPFGELVGEFTWFEPDARELVRTLRRVYENREEAARRGTAAAEKVRADFRWSSITKMYRERIEALIGGNQQSDRSQEAEAKVLQTAQ
jgi:glycosyltransferase involved in cell wall biosynthesis